MRLVFFLVAFCGLLYFLFSYRQFDFFSLSFFSSCMYFSPGFLGFTFQYEPGNNSGEILDATYLVMILVLSAIILGALIFDKHVHYKRLSISLNKVNYISHIALLLSIAGFLLTIYQSRSIFYLSDKSVILENVSRWHTIWVVSAGISAVLSFIKKKYLIFSISMLLILLDFYVGFRVTIVLTVISIMTYLLSNNGKSRIAISRWKEILFFSFSAIFILLYKQFYILVKLREWNLIIYRLNNFRGIIDTLTRSEPFIIQATLNEVIRNNFHASLEHFSGIFHNFILFSPNLGIETISFNSLFQPVLFPNITSGMASNIWAEMWSIGGWLLLIFFVFLYVLFISLGSYLLNITDPALKGLIIILFSYWSFYIHRNDISYQITLERRVFLIWLFCLIGSYLVLTILPTKFAYETD